MQPRLVIAAIAALSLVSGLMVTVRAGEADDQYRLAAVHYQQKRWELAAAEFRSFLADYPGDNRVAAGQFYLGEALVQLRDFPAAAQAFTQAQRASDADLKRKALYRAGEARYLAGRPADAEHDLEEFCRRYPDDKLAGYALAFRGEIALADNRVDDAERHFRAALDSKLEGALADDCRLGLAQVWQKQRRLEDAQQLLSDLADAGGAKQAEAHFHLAMHAYAAADYQTAESSFAAAEAAASGNLDKKDTTGGTAATNQSLADRAQLGRARCLFHMQKYGQAATVLESLTEHGLLRAEARYWLGLTRKAQGEWDLAAPLLAAAADAATTTERQTAAQAELAACYAGAQKFAEAKAAYKALLIEHPTEELRRSTTEVLAATALAGGELSWSAELYESLSGDDQPAACAARGLLGLARSQRANDQSEAALATLTRLLARYPQESAVLEGALLHGQTLEQLDRADDALNVYKAIIKQHAVAPEADDALARAAQLCTTLKRWHDAGSYYQQLIARPSHAIDRDLILYRWASVAARDDQASDSYALFERLRTEYPASVYYGEATCRLAHRAIQEKRYTAADELLSTLNDRVLSDDVDDRQLFLRGQSAAGQEKWDAVATPLEQLIANHSDSPRRLAAEYWIAEAEYHQEHFDQAATKFAALEGRLRDGASADAAAWRAMVPLRRAQIFAQQADWTEALETATSITKAYPDFSQQFEADYVIGRAYAARAEFDQARQAYRRVIASAAGGKTETAAMAQWMIGETYMHQGNYQGALREYLKVEILHAYPKWQAAALLQAGKCQELLKKPREATATYQRLLHEYPDTKFDQEAALRLAQLRR
ncbi:MAG TPA: tetratricopeptide repeat protein [Pirellulales bacterium]|jgi:TolA-binding protein